MGATLFAGLGTKEKRILLVGLEAAGKTTVLYKLKLNEVTTQTIGFSVDTVKYKNLILPWDVGSQDKYYQHTQGIIYVVDSNDRGRVDEAARELQKILREDELRDAVLLVLANKQDLPNSMTVDEVTDKLGLHSLRSRQWFIQATSAASGIGLFEALDWLSNTLSGK